MNQPEGWGLNWNVPLHGQIQEQFNEQLPQSIHPPLREPLRESLLEPLHLPLRDPAHRFENNSNGSAKGSLNVSDLSHADKEAIHRFMTADLFRDPLQHIPQSPVTAEIPFFVSRSSTGSNASLRDAPAHLPPLLLPPTCMEGDMCELSKHPVSYHDSVRSRTAGHGFGRISYQLLNGREPMEVVNLFRCPSSDPFSRLAHFWKICCETSTIRKHVMRLLDDGGIRLERRKRMATRIPPEEKKAIRAQRNRERSQALRRHQKRRLALLEEANRHLAVENGAIKAMVLAVAYMSHDDGFLRRSLRNYAGKALLDFLGLDFEHVNSEECENFLAIH